jgi:hypothetical protein
VSDRNQRRFAARANSARERTSVPQLEIRGPLTDAQVVLVAEHGYRSLEAYRALLFRLRFGQGAERLAQTSMDWRVNVPVPPTSWFVERDHFRGIRNMDLSDVEKVRIHLRTVGPAAPPGPPGSLPPPAPLPYPGSVLVHVVRSEHGIGTQVDYLFEHDELGKMERYTFGLVEGWHGYERPTSAEPWVEVPIGDVP